MERVYNLKGVNDMEECPMIWRYLGKIGEYLDDHLSDSVLKRMLYVLLRIVLIPIFVILGISLSIVEMFIMWFIVSPIRFIIYGRDYD